MSDQEEDQYTSVNKGPRPNQMQVYSLYTLGYDVKTVVQSSDGAQRGALILVPALFYNK